jgi:hypothetical protein
MDYQKVYNSIVERGQVREPDPDGYYEVHHIIPKCMGGGNEKENLTTLTAREHFIAHWLLARIYPKESGIRFSFWIMCNGFENSQQERYTVSSRTYSEARVMRSEAMKLRWRDPSYKESTIFKIRETFNSDEYRKKRSGIAKKLWETPLYREKVESSKKSSEYKDLMSKRAIERWEDEGYRSEMSEKSKNMWRDEKKREEMILGISKATKSEKFRKERSEHSLSLWKKEEFREKNLDGIKKSWEGEGGEDKRNRLKASLSKTLNDPDRKDEIFKSRRDPEYRKNMSDVQKKFSREKSLVILEDLKNGMGINAASRKHGCGKGIIYKIKNGLYYSDDLFRPDDI